MFDDVGYMLIMCSVIGIAGVGCTSFFLVEMSGDIGNANGDSACLI